MLEMVQEPFHTVFQIRCYWGRLLAPDLTAICYWGLRSVRGVDRDV